MPSRHSFVLLLTALAAGGLFLSSGCASPDGGRKKVVQTGQPLSSPDPGPQDDYSPAAVEARTLSHAHYAMAALYDENDQPGKAAEEMVKAAEADLANTELTLDAASRLLKLRRHDDAIAFLLKATARREAPAAVHSRLGLAYAMAGKRDLAIEANRRALQKDPANLAAYQYLAQLYLQNQQADEGLKLLDTAAKQSKADAEWLIDIGETLILFARGGKMDAAKPRALDLFKRALALKPTNPALLQRLAEGFAFFGEQATAARIYTGLVDELPKAPGLRERLVEILLRGDNRSNAIPQLRALVADNPANPRLNFLLGSLLFTERQSKEAVDFLRNSIRLDERFEPAYHDLAAALINLDQTGPALETLENARKKFAPSFVTEFYAALAHSRNKDYTNSLRFFSAAEVIARVNKETNRFTPSFFFQLGAAHERCHQFKEAENYFRKALSISPDFAEALNYLGYMWAERGENLDEARVMIEKAVKLEPNNAAFLDSLGWVLFKLDQPQEALRWIQKAIERNEEPDATLYEHLGDILSVLRQPEEARRAYQRAYSIEPGEKLQRKLQSSATPPATP